MTDERTQEGVMSDAEMEAAQARCDAATPGEWETWQGDDEAFRANSWTPVPDDKVWNIDVYGRWIARVVWDEADARFIAHARTDLPLALNTARHYQERARIAEEQLGMRNAVITAVIAHVKAELGELEPILGTFNSRDWTEAHQQRLDALYDFVLANEPEATAGQPVEATCLNCGKPIKPDNEMGVCHACADEALAADG